MEKKCVVGTATGPRLFAHCLPVVAYLLHLGAFIWLIGLV